MSGDQAATIALFAEIAVAALCIYLGYKLLLAGAAGEFKLLIAQGTSGVGLESTAPGLLVMFLGAVIALWAFYAFSAYGHSSDPTSGNSAATLAVVLVLGVSALSIYLGYRLFLAGATGAFTFRISRGGGNIGLESVAPGSLFIFLGALIAFFAAYAFAAYGH